MNADAVDMFDASEAMLIAIAKVTDKHKDTGYARATGTLVGQLSYALSKMPKAEGEQMLASFLESMDNISKL